MLKNKKILFTFLMIIFIIFFALYAKSYAITLPWLSISSNNYSEGDMVNANIDIVEVNSGETLQLYTMFIYGNGMPTAEKPAGKYVLKNDISDVTWRSSDTSIATVDNNGMVLGIAEGKVTITAECSDGDGDHSADYTITVKGKTKPTNAFIMINGKKNNLIKDIVETRMNIGETAELKFGYHYNENALEGTIILDSRKIKWTSSDENIVKISDDGKIECIEEGSAVITATYDGMKATLNIGVQGENIPENPKKASFLEKIIMTIRNFIVNIINKIFKK